MCIRLEYLDCSRLKVTIKIYAATTSIEIVIVKKKLVKQIVFRSIQNNRGNR